MDTDTITSSSGTSVSMTSSESPFQSSSARSKSLPSATSRLRHQPVFIHVGPGCFRCCVELRLAFFNEMGVSVHHFLQAVADQFRDPQRRRVLHDVLMDE